MVVQGILALALALPTGLLFGVGYGTGVRIGYEQVYPLLFPKGAQTTNSEQLQTNMKAINTIYNTIGGKEASNMGIAQGLNNARSELENNPDFRWLEELALKLSGPTPSNSVNLNQSGGTPSSVPPVVPSNEADILNKVPSRETIFKITDIPSLFRLEDRLRALPIQTPLIITAIAYVRARIRKLRDSASSVTPNTTSVPLPDAPRRDATSLEKEATIWNNKLFEQQQIYLSETRRIESMRGFAERTTQQKKTILRQQSSSRQAAIIFILNASREYRHPNNIIRRAALQLRQQRANGNWI